MSNLTRTPGLVVALSASLIVAACRPAADSPANADNPPAAAPAIAMGGAKSVTRFFITSKCPGTGGNLGGLAGADAYCQMMVSAEGAGDHTWRAYLRTTATGEQAAVNARNRIGNGPWYNSGGILVSANLEQLHSANTLIGKETAVTERLDEVNGVGDTPNVHDILTGSRPDGTAFDGADMTCNNWTSSAGGQAQVGHHDRMGQGESATSWNSAHASRGCSQSDLESTGGAGLFYCFAID